MYIYPAFFYKDDDGYSVVFKDLELATGGSTLQEALLMAEEALTGRVYLMLQDGETLPAATEIENITKPQDADFVTLIKTDKNVTLPAWLAEAAENANLNFSQELQNALKQRLQIAL